MPATNDEVPSLRRPTNPRDRDGWRLAKDSSLSLSLSLFRSLSLDRPPARVAFRSSPVRAPYARVVVPAAYLGSALQCHLPANFAVGNYFRITAAADPAVRYSGIIAY